MHPNNEDLWLIIDQSSYTKDETIIQLQQLLIEDYIKYLSDKASMINYSLLDKVYLLRTRSRVNEYQEL